MSYAVQTYTPVGLPSSARRGEPFRLLACHTTEGAAGVSGARGTINWMASTAGGRNASYHELWAWEPTVDRFVVLRCVPATRAAHSVAPQPTNASGQGLYTPDAWVRNSLGAGWRDPNYWVYAISIAGRVADVDAWARDKRFLAHCRRRFIELRRELGVDRRAEHFRFNPRTRSDWGRTLTTALGGLEVPDAPFSDVKPGDRFYDAIDWLNETGISTGTGGGKYEPDRPLTRGEMAAFLHRFARHFGIEKD